MELLAPNGKPSNLTPEQYRLVRTPEFKAWFGDWENSPETASKVVDSNGEPLVVYHATDNKFWEFEKEKQIVGYYGKGFYFSSSLEKSKDYGKRVIPAFLNIKSVFTLSDETPQELLNELAETDFEVPSSPSQLGWREENDIEQRSKYTFGYASKNSDVFMRNLIKNGFYGIKMTYDLKNEINFFIAFEPNQIKLADGTNTTFDSNNPDIRYAKGGKLELYHGGQKVFNKFKTNLVDRIDYGWGLYFSDSEEVAKYYARQPFDRPLIFKTIWDSDLSLDEKGDVLYCVRKNLLDIQKSKKELNEKFYPLLDKIEQIIKNKGVVYKVDVEKGRWLDWDKKVPEYIRLMFTDIKPEFFESGEDLYNYLSRKEQSKKKASIILLNKGIEGIRYKISNNITNTNIKGYNYVVFDANDVVIEKKKLYNGGGLTMKKPKAKFLAPNGKPSNLNEVQHYLVRTPEFKAWFGDWENSPETASKVVDENGEPLVVFHGSSKIFNEFEPKFINAYSSNPETHFINNRDYADGFGNNIYECFLDIKTPEYITKNGLFEPYSEESDGTIILKFIDSRYKELQKANRYAVFSRYQIKLADGTNTTFDSKNPDIRYAKGGEVEFEDNRWNFNLGDCGLYAIALHRVYGFPIYVCKGYFLEEDWGGKREMEGEVSHAVVKLPNGNYLDHDGELTEKQLLKNTYYGSNNKEAKKNEKIETVTEKQAKLLFRCGSDESRCPDMVKEKEIQEVVKYIMKKKFNKKYILDKPIKSGEVQNESRESAKYLKSKFSNGGTLIEKDIFCSSCGWGWNKHESEESDVYVCHKCGTDNNPAHQVTIKEENFGFFKIYLGEKEVGYISYDFDKGLLEIISFFIKSEYRNKGIGTIARKKIVELLKPKEIRGSAVSKQSFKAVIKAFGKPYYMGSVYKQYDDIDDAMNYLPNYTNVDEIEEEIRAGESDGIYYTIKLADGGSISDLLSSQEVEYKLGRELHWWNDDIVYLSGIEYKKVYLRPEYKKV